MQTSLFIENEVKSIQEKVGDKKVLCAMSGGVDSAVAAVLIHKAIGTQLTCIFVDHGCMRKNEGAEVERVFRKGLGMNLICVDAKDRFLARLAGVTEPEQKRKIIGKEFIRVFEEEAVKLGKIDFLAQGTIYPDIVESDNVKSHHNVGGLPKHVDFEDIIEPLKALYKEDVRAVGTYLGLPEHMVQRQPFPGPGIAVRIIGEVTPERTSILQEVDAIFCEEIEKLPMVDRPKQYFAVLTNMRSVGVSDGTRTYNYTVALRAVTTKDFMHAEWIHLPYDLLERASARITKEVSSVGRVVYDVTSKPPATIEWE